MRARRAQVAASLSFKCRSTFSDLAKVSRAYSLTNSGVGNRTATIYGDDRNDRNYFTPRYYRRRIVATWNSRRCKWIARNLAESILPRLCFNISFTRDARSPKKLNVENQEVAENDDLPCPHLFDDSVGRKLIPSSLKDVSKIFLDKNRRHRYTYNAIYISEKRKIPLCFSSLIFPYITDLLLPSLSSLFSFHLNYRRY